MRRKRNETQPFESYILFTTIALLSLLFSCSSQRISKYNKLEIGDYQYFTNRKIQLSVRFFGDYEFYNPTDLSELAWLHCEFSKYSTSRDLIHQRTLIYANRTKISPFFNGGAWVFNQGKLNMDKIKEDFTFTFNEPPINSYFEKIGMSRCEEIVCIIRIYTLKKKQLVLAACLKSLEKNLSDAEIFDLITSEYHTIFNTVKIGFSVK